jgi:hypothetical protein
MARSQVVATRPSLRMTQTELSLLMVLIQQTAHSQMATRHSLTIQQTEQSQLTTRRTPRNQQTQHHLQTAQTVQRLIQLLTQLANHQNIKDSLNRQILVQRTAVPIAIKHLLAEVNTVVSENA